MRDGFLRRLKHNRPAAPDNDPHRSGSQDPSVVVNATHARVHTYAQMRARIARTCPTIKRKRERGLHGASAKWNETEVEILI